jgi:cobalt/nickel transport system permease protein
MAVATALGLAYRLLYHSGRTERLQRRAQPERRGAARRRHLVAAMAGATLGRAFVRAERTHAAMLARGFRGTLPLLHATPWTAGAALNLVGLCGLALAVAASARLP